MRHVVVIVGDYSPHQSRFPIAGEYAGNVVLFADRTNPLAARQAGIKQLMALDEVGSLEVLHLAPSSPRDCLVGIHHWRAIDEHGWTVGARCVHCGRTEELEPVHVSAEYVVARAM